VSDKKYGFETLSVHAGAAPDPATGARALPIYQTTAYVFEDADHAAALFNLQTVGFIYSRLTNPTNAALESRLHGDGVGPFGAGTGAVPTDEPRRRHHRVVTSLWRLAAADAQHVPQVRLEGEHRRRR
jgi:O-acetylhomoserine/O-acetylserine sulfhydrylase-like pyridoxal-dependent enzyme